MSRPKVEIIVKRCKRLKQILEETETKQNQLKDIGLSQQAISAMVNENANVTETTARLIVDRFPQYSFEWLMGWSDYKNESQFASEWLRDAAKADRLLSAGLSAFASLNGYEISPPKLTADCNDISKATLTMVSGYVISKGEQSAELSPEEMDAFENEVCDFVELKLRHLLKQKGADING